MSVDPFTPSRRPRREARPGDGPEDPDRPDSLWEPLSGDHGAHGAFDRRARRWSPHLWLVTHPGLWRGVTGSLAVAAGIWAGRRAGR